MKIKKLTILAVVVLVAGLMSFGVETAQAATPSCGDTLTSSVHFDSDLDCTAIAANTAALTVGASNITINLGGFTLSGPASSTACPSGSGDDTKGILVEGFDNVNILNGAITGFERGVRVKNAAGINITNIEAHANVNSAVRVRENADVTVNRGYFHDNLNDAMGVSSGSHVTLMNSWIVDNCASGIFGNNTPSTTPAPVIHILNNRFTGNFRSAINCWRQECMIHNNFIQGNNSDTTASQSSDFGQISLVDPGTGDVNIRCNDIRDSVDANSGAIERGIGFRISVGAGSGEVMITRNIFTNNPQGGVFIDENGAGSSTIEVHKNTFASAADLAIAFDAGATNWTIDASKNFVGTSAGYGAPGSNTLTTAPDLRSAQHCRAAAARN